MHSTGVARGLYTSPHANIATLVASMTNSNPRATFCIAGDDKLSRASGTAVSQPLRCACRIPPAPYLGRSAATSQPKWRTDNRAAKSCERAARAFAARVALPASCRTDATRVVQTSTGNHVVVALDDGQFTLYAHLQTSSVRVQPGDRVECGPLLGRVGNTGNSTEPHLHFHVMDGATPLQSDGLPYAFDRFDLRATIDISTGVPVLVAVTQPQLRRDRLPVGFDVVEFRDEGRSPPPWPRTGPLPTSAAQP